MTDQRYPTVDEYLELHKDDPIVWEEGQPHLISVEELRAAGALDCPPEWRKHLSPRPPKPVQRNLFSELTDDDEDAPAKA